jgi:hypothetical protein
MSEMDCSVKFFEHMIASLLRYETRDTWHAHLMTNLLRRKNEAKYVAQILINSYSMIINLY